MILDPSKSKENDELVKKALAENQKQIDAMKQSYESKLAEAKSQIQSVDSEKFLLNEKAKKTPHLSNINMDPSLSHSIKIIFDSEGQKKIGVQGKADIVLYGLR